MTRPKQMTDQYNQTLTINIHIRKPSLCSRHAELAATLVSEEPPSEEEEEKVEIQFGANVSFNL
jgi:hypothetical protein